MMVSFAAGPRNRGIFLQDVLKIALTLLTAVFGGWIGVRLKIPAGAMIGALVATVILNLTLGLAYIPTPWKTVLQLFTGILLGVKIRREDIRGLKTLLVPLAILLISMVIYNLLFGTAIYLSSDLDLVTALFATAPGGMTDMAIISDDLGANSSYVVILQLSRLMVIYLCFPPIFRKLAGKKKEQTPSRAASPVRKEAEKGPSRSRKDWVGFGGSLLSGAAVGLLFWKLGITAGALVGGMIGAAAFHIIAGRGWAPRACGRYLRYFSGAYIGQKVTVACVLGMGDLLLPILILAAGVFVFLFGVGFLLHRFSREDKLTCMFIASPGGVQEMSLLAEDLGADATKTALMQTARLASVIALFPTMIRFASSLLGL
jgi:membrane AbrB-like protein